MYLARKQKKTGIIASDPSTQVRETGASRVLVMSLTKEFMYLNHVQDINKPCKNPDLNTNNIYE